MFIGQSLPDLNQEMMEDLYLRREEIENELDEETEDNSRKSRVQWLHEQLNKVREALGEKAVIFDPLWDYWESELAAGRTPDLDMTLAELEQIQRIDSTYGDFEQ